jgi:hypothetical protein
MFAPGGTPHSNGKNKVDEEGWPTWRGGGCQCIGSKFRCDLKAEVPLDDRSPAPGEVINNGRAGNATDFYNSLNGACSFQGLSMDINKSDTAFARWSSEVNLQEHFTATTFGGIAKKYRRRDLIAKVDSAHEGCSPSAKLLRRADHSASWDIYAPKGLPMWNAFRSRDQNQADRTICDFYDYNVKQNPGVSLR